MKKFLAMILSIMLLALPCASLADADAAAETDADAVAETDAAGEAIEFTYDPDVIAQAGLEGEFVSLADMGILFQFFLPNTLTAQDLTEDQAATGAIALFVNEDATNSMSIGYGMAVDAEGNTVTTLEELNAAYASAGCEDMEYATINGIPCMSYSIKASDVPSCSTTAPSSPSTSPPLPTKTSPWLPTLSSPLSCPLRILKRRLNFWGFGHSKRFRFGERFFLFGRKERSKEKSFRSVSRKPSYVQAF